AAPAGCQRLSTRSLEDLASPTASLALILFWRPSVPQPSLWTSGHRRSPSTTWSRRPSLFRPAIIASSWAPSYNVSFGRERRRDGSIICQTISRFGKSVSTNKERLLKIPHLSIWLVGIVSVMVLACSSSSGAPNDASPGGRVSGRVPAQLWGEMRPVVSVKELMHDL